MLTLEERFNLWDDYKKKLDALVSEVDDDLFCQFSQHGKNPDDDMPIAREFWGILDKLSDFVNTHHKELHDNLLELARQHLNAQCSLNAWSVGLCPKTVWHLCERNLLEIAAFKATHGISKEDSERALQLWEDSRSVKASA